MGIFIQWRAAVLYIHMFTILILSIGQVISGIGSDTYIVGPSYGDGTYDEGKEGVMGERKTDGYVDI